MAVTDYLQKTGGTCRYSYSKLKDVLYLVSAEHLKDVHIDNGEAYIDYIEGQEELPLRINGFNIQFNEETSLDERYKFQKTLTLSMHGYVNYKIFEGKYYAIIEDVEGTFWMINVDFPSRITHTFNLGKDTNQTDFTFSSLSNYPTLKLNADFEAVSPVCLGLNVHGIDKLELIEFEKAKLNTINRNVTSTEPFKKIEFLGDSCTFQEVYDGNRVTDTISFNIAFDNYKPSWRWNLLEFLDNKYSAIITPKGNDNKYYTGYNLGLNPSYTIQTASNNGESDIITITLVEMSSYGSTAAVDWDEEHSTETRWRYVKNIGETICWECVGYSLAKYLVKQETDLFGNPTGNYQVMEGYESQFSNLHIVGTFTEEELFQNTECATATTCDIQTNIPNAIYYNAATCYTYNLKTSCDWEFDNIPNNITVSPSSGEANSSYTVSICNTVAPSSTPLENYMTLNCCSTSRVINLRVQNELSCVRPLVQNINCLSQNVQFAFDGDCNLVVTSISSALTYSFDGDYFVVNVPKNTEDLSRTYTISVTNCNCSTETTNVTIVQDKMYSVWSEDMTGYMCENGNKYKISRLYTGTTLNNLVRTDETKTGSLIESGSTDCATSITKWDWDNESYYCVGGNKFKTEFEYISYDGGTNWVKTGNTRLGSIVETESEWCNSAVTYSWVASRNYECSGTTSYYMYQKYEQRGEEDPIPVYPSVLSIDADGTQPLNKKMDNDTNCGYSPVIEPIYRWVNLNISSDYVCDVCSFTGKWIATYSGGTTSSAECDASSAITENEITLTDLVSVEIGDCVTSIGEWTFFGCNSLTNCTIGSGVTSIGERAFAVCASLTSITIPNSVTSIGGVAFGDCISLTSINIPSGVTSIGENAFAFCNSLTSVTVNATTPPPLNSSSWVFYGTPIANGTGYIYVPSASVNAYKSADGWSTYASQIRAITT